MVRIRLAGLILLTTLWPATARADWLDIWGFLDQLSGPGPYKSRFWINPEFRIPTPWHTSSTAEGDRANPFIEKPKVAVAANVPRLSAVYPAVRLSWFRSHEDRNSQGQAFRFLDSTSPFNTKPVDVVAIDPSLMFHVGKAVDVGVGVSFMQFSGEGFATFWKAGLILPKTTVSPIAFFGNPDLPWKHFLNVSLDAVLIGGVSGKNDFEDPTTKYDTTGHYEYLLRAGVQVDVEALIVCAVHRSLCFP